MESEAESAEPDGSGLLGWEGGVHWASGLGKGLRPDGKWFLAGEGEGLLGVVEAKPRTRNGLGSLGFRDGSNCDAFTHESVNETAVTWMGTQLEFCSVNLYATHFWCSLRAVGFLPR